MTTCYGYTRISTVKQGEGVSLEAQREAISRYADSNGLTITKWFEERETAAKSGRPIFNAIVRDLMKKKAQGLIVHKIDRSARHAVCTSLPSASPSSISRSSFRMSSSEYRFRAIPSPPFSAIVLAQF